MKNCLACQLNNNPKLVPAGRITETNNWIVEHCIGNLGIGSVVIKTKKHREQFSKCSQSEIIEFGKLLKITHQAIEELFKPDQIYFAKWGEETKHLHIIVQPVTKKTRKKYKAKGPTLQAKMLKEGELDLVKAKKAAIKIKQWINLND